MTKTEAGLTSGGRKSVDLFAPHAVGPVAILTLVVEYLYTVGYDTLGFPRGNIGLNILRDKNGKWGERGHPALTLFTQRY